jgi:hypothetical protein
MYRLQGGEMKNQGLADEKLLSMPYDGLLEAE